MITPNIANKKEEEINKNAEFLASKAPVDEDKSSKLDTNQSDHVDVNGPSAKKVDDVTSQERNVEKGQPDDDTPIIKRSDNSDSGSNCYRAEEVELLEQHELAIRPSKSKNEKAFTYSDGSGNRYKETLNLLSTFLEHYVSKDHLDQDSFDSIIVRMNKAAFLRKRRIQIIDNNNIEEDKTIDNEVGYIWHDNDLYNTGQKNYLHSFINVVDADFFYEIVDAVEAATNILLDEDAIKNLQQSLAIQDDGKKRKRLNLKVIVAMEDGFISPILVKDNNSTENCASVSPSEKINEEKRRRVTRGSARSRLSKDKEEHRNSGELGLETLLSAMIELEQAAGRPIDLTKKIVHQRKLRKRKKNPKYIVDALSGDEMQRLFDDEGREVAKIIVGGKLFASPKKRGPKRKKMSIHEVRDVRFFDIVSNVISILTVSFTFLERKYNFK